MPGVAGGGVLGPGRYLSAPTEPRPLELLFDDVVGYTREWKLAGEPAGPAAPTMFCAQAGVVHRSGRVAATVTVSAFEPADENEARTVAANVARSLRLTPAPEETVTDPLSVAPSR